jgi:hypothetical protein
MSFFQNTAEKLPEIATTNGVHLMVDIETLGTESNAPIISVGAVLFDPQGNDTFAGLHSRSFLRLIDVEDAVRTCGPASGGTIAWWFTQSDAAIKRLVGGGQVSVQDAFRDLWAYSHSRHARQPEWHRNLPVPTRIWAKDPDFDCSIIRSACGQVRQVYPFHFAYQRSVRTALDLGFPDGEFPTFADDRQEAEGVVAHDARDDAIMQALSIQAVMQALGQSRERIAFIKN